MNVRRTAMAEKEGIRNRIRKLNRRALEVSNAIAKALLKDGYRGAIVTTTELCRSEKADKIMACNTETT